MHYVNTLYVFVIIAYWYFEIICCRVYVSAPWIDVWCHQANVQHKHSFWDDSAETTGAKTLREESDSSSSLSREILRALPATRNKTRVEPWLLVTSPPRRLRDSIVRLPASQRRIKKKLASTRLVSSKMSVCVLCACDLCVSIIDYCIIAALKLNVFYVLGRRLPRLLLYAFM